MNNEQLYKEAEQVFETVEDTVSYICDEENSQAKKFGVWFTQWQKQKLNNFQTRIFNYGIKYTT